MPVITLHARRWFERTNGNTYHTVTIEVAGAVVHQTGIHYGYGDQYITTAYEWFKNYMPDALESLSKSEFSRIHGHGFYVVDVPRKKDL
jgi:hypothetical protein